MGLSQTLILAQDLAVADARARAFRERPQIGRRSVAGRQ